jgi:hypothetical protein
VRKFELALDFESKLELGWTMILKINNFTIYSRNLSFSWGLHRSTSCNLSFSWGLGRGKGNQWSWSHSWNLCGNWSWSWNRISS